MEGILITITVLTRVDATLQNGFFAMPSILRQPTYVCMASCNIQYLNEIQ